MKDGGWDTQKIEEKERLVLPGKTCDRKFNRIKENNWIATGWTSEEMSTSFWGAGRVELTFANCNKEGEVSVLIDGVEIEKSKPNGQKTTAIFNVEQGTVISIRTDDHSIIRIMDLQIQCGKLIKYNLIICYLKT